jgi:hypothetical protein
VTPRQESLGHISELALILLSVFDSGEAELADNAERLGSAVEIGSAE